MWGYQVSELGCWRAHTYRGKFFSREALFFYLPTEFTQKTIWQSMEKISLFTTQPTAKRLFLSSLDLFSSILCTGMRLSAVGKSQQQPKSSVVTTQQNTACSRCEDLQQ